MFYNLSNATLIYFINLHLLFITPMAAKQNNA